MANFTEEAKTAFEASRSDSVSLFKFRKQMKEEGPWKSGSTYLILVRDGLVAIHANDSEAEDRNLRELVPKVEMLLDKLDDNNGTTQCIMYNDHEGVTGRYACAVTINSSGPSTSFLIGGLHHGKLPEEDFSTLLGSDYPVETEASDVVNAETLKAFVKGARDALEKQFNV